MIFFLILVVGLNQTICSQSRYSLTIEKLEENVRSQLISAIRPNVTNKRTRNGSTFYFEEIGDANLSKSSQVIVFRTIQELINNSIKHSNCDEITVQLITDETTFTVLIEDNGIGFDLNKAFDKLQSRGLKNIYDRCNALGAKLNIDTQPGRGTTVIIEMKTNA